MNYARTGLFAVIARTLSTHGVIYTLPAQKEQALQGTHTINRGVSKMSSKLA